MRKYFYVGSVVAAALIAALPATAAEAAPVHVLTIGRVGGPAVAVNAVLKASLAPRTTAVFNTTIGKMTCTISTFTAKVVTNPAKGRLPATARESITAETFSRCKISVPNVTILRLTVGNLPYNATVSDARGFPVRISGRSRAKPLLVTATVKAGTSTITCSVKAASISGAASNRGNRIAFVNQKFVKAACAFSVSGTFSATYGPVRDTSVRGNPAVFVN